ncbi:MAG: leucine-rich repeat domain-containing protein [Mogibacterium sp.]|nr:leucine-rich repeat domain-containing protein [Mogibacterium sp.]
MSIKRFRGQNVITAGLNRENLDKVKRLVKKHGGRLVKAELGSARSYECFVYDPHAKGVADKVRFVRSLIDKGELISVLTLDDFFMITDPGRRVIKIDEYKDSWSDAPVYEVEEIDISGAEADDWEVEWRYDYKYACQEAELWIVEYHGTKEHIIVPSSINGVKVTGIGSQHDEKTAFNKCRARRIDIPGSLKIGRNVGSNNGFVQTVTVGEGCKELRSDFFYWANSLTEARISASVSFIGFSLSRAPFFYTQWYDRTIAIFGYITYGSVIFIPENRHTFTNSVIIPEWLPAALLDYLRNYCGDMPEYLFPKSLQALQDVYEDSLDWIREFRGFKIVIGNTLYQLGKLNIVDNTLIIPEGVGSIGMYAQSMSTDLSWNTLHNINHIKFPDTLRCLGSSCIDPFDRVMELTLPDKLETIAPHCFANLRLRRLVIPDSVIEIGEGVMESAHLLEELTFPESLKSLESNAFNSHFHLKKLVLPFSVEQLGVHAVDTGGKKIDFAGVRIPTAALNGNTYYMKPDRDLLIRYKALLIYNNTMYQDPEYPPDMIPVSAEEFDAMLKDGAVRSSMVIRITPENEYDAVICNIEDLPGQAVLKKYYGSEEYPEIPDNVTVIDAAAFEDNKNIKGIDLKNVEFIGGNAFSGCTEMRFVKMDHVSEIGERAFYSCSNLDFKALPDPLKSIGKGAFAWAGVRSVDLHDMEEIPEELFAVSERLKHVDISNARVIRKKAFYQCDLLDIDSLPESLEVIEENAFSSIRDGMVIPRSVRTIGTNCFGYERGLPFQETPIRRVTIYKSLLYEFRNIFTRPKRKKFGDGRGLSIILVEITILDDESGEIVGFIPFYATREDKKLDFIEAFRPDNTFDYSVLDEDKSRDFIWVQEIGAINKLAIQRLKHPYGLTGDARKKHIDHLKSQAVSVSASAAAEGDIDTIKVLVENGVINKKNITDIIDKCAGTGDIACRAYLLEYRMKLGVLSDPVDGEL